MTFFISIVPAVRMPVGMDVFDYRVSDGSNIEIGDLITVPFRRKSTIALVVARSETSSVADKTVLLDQIPLHYRGTEMMKNLLLETAAQTFSSPATVMQSWMRTVPIRVRKLSAILRKETQQTLRLASRSTTIYTTERMERVVDEARRATGRVLIVTPWKTRADAYAAELDCSALHADRTPTAAWSAIRHFLDNENAVLITTRIGAWLSHAADVVIVDEPENDDHKQDELTPRFDARWIVEAAGRLRPTLQIIRVSTTPRLERFSEVSAKEIPTIVLPLTTETPTRRGRSSVESITAQSLNRIQEAVDDARPVIVLHAIHGERGSITCRDCRWHAVCESCSASLSRESTLGHCRRCGRRQAIPSTCPSCGGAELNRSLAGVETIRRELNAAIPSPLITVMTMQEWNAHAHEKFQIPNSTFAIPHSLFTIHHSRPLFVITGASLIGGIAEDVRRRERMVIAWRRLASEIATMQGEIIAQAPEGLTSQLHAWLEGTGVKNWAEEEVRDRRLFRYPPTDQRIKLLVDGTESTANALRDLLIERFPCWSIEGPWLVSYRAVTRKSRFAIHALPSVRMNTKDVHQAFAPFAREAIIDLDPIAFFS